MGGTTVNLKKALLTSSATALLPYDLEPTLHEELIAMQPLLQLINLDQASAKTHEYSLRTAHPQGWFEGESTPANPLASTYVRKSVVLKIGRIWGGVTGFARSVDERFIDALSAELEGSLQGMSDLLEYSILFGCATDITAYTGDAYQTTGLLPIIFNAGTNLVDGGSNKIDLADLDSALALAKNYRQVRNDPYMWFMSMKMKQVVDGLQTKVQLPLQSVTLPDGKIEMAAYGGAPIFETNYTQPGTTSPATVSALAAGGSLPDTIAYTHQISSVTYNGECIAGAAGTQRTTGGGNNKINLTWTHDDNANLYIIWRKTASGTYNLLDIVAARTYDAAGTVNGNVEAYSDAGAKTENSAVHPLVTGEEQIVLANRHSTRGINLLGKVDDMGRQLENFLTYVELARTKDTYDYMLKAYFAFLTRYANLHAVIRHVKLV